MSAGSLCPACGEATSVAPNARAAAAPSSTVPSASSASTVPPAPPAPRGSSAATAPPAATASPAPAASASSTVPPAAAACAACGADLAPLQLCDALGAAEGAAASRALRRGCYREALSHLDRAAALRPLGAAERRLRGLALLGAGRPTAAMGCLAETPESVVPGFAILAAEARYGAARALAEAGDPAGALRTLAQGSATGDGLVLYALCALRLGERAAAAAALRAALEIDPSNSHAAALLRL